jgi:hypothetical protein
MSVLLLINIMLSIYGLAVMFPSDIFIYINFSTIPMFSTIIQLQIDDFKNTLKDKKQINYSELIKRQLVEIIEMQLKYNEQAIRTSASRPCCLPRYKNCVPKQACKRTQHKPSNALACVYVYMRWSSG